MCPIALVGFMGAGKTTVGRALAKELGRRFADLDAEVSRRTGLSVARLFEQEGEAAFRLREIEALDDLLADPTAPVIGCGGGVVTTEAGRKALGRATVVYLAIREEVLVSRLAGSKRRPLIAGLEGEELAARVHELLAARRPMYAQVADIAVDAAKPTKHVVARIVRQLDARERDEGKSA